MFKLGDKVRCISNEGANLLTVGKVYRVCTDQFRQWVKVSNDVNYKDTYGASRFELVTEKEVNMQTETKQPHKHRDLIIAWANGATIQSKSYSTGYWYNDDAPAWSRDVERRIKPEPKPDQSRTMFVELHPKLDNAYNNPNLKLTFDGETGKLKAVEIINND